MFNLNKKFAIGAVVIFSVAFAACTQKNLESPNSSTTQSPSITQAVQIGDIDNPNYQDPNDMDEDNFGGEILATPTPTPLVLDPTPTPIPNTENLINPDENQESAGVNEDQLVGNQSEQGTIKDENDINKSFFVTFDGVKVELCPYAGLTLNPASSDDIDAAVANKLASIKEEIYISDPAKVGDFVNITYYANVIDDSFEYENAYNEDGIVSRLGYNELILGFENHIIGKRAGDTTSFKYTFASDYPDERYAGKTATFYITVNSVYRYVSPSLSDESVNTYFGYANVSDFVMDIKKEANRKAYENQIWDVLLNNTEVSNTKSSDIKSYADFLYQKYMNFADANSWQYDFDTAACIEANFGYASLDALKKQTDAVARSKYKEYYIIRAIAKDMGIEKLSSDDYSYRFNEYMASIDFNSTLPYEYNEFETDYEIYKSVVMDFIISKAKFTK